MEGEEKVPGIEVRENQDGSKSYRVKIRLKGQPKITKTFPNITLAKRWKQKTEVEMRKGIYEDDRDQHTLEEAIDRYISSVLPFKPKDAINVRRHLEWWKQRIGPLSLKAITPSVIAEQRDALTAMPTPSGKPRAPATVLRILCHLSVVLSAAREWEWIKENPISKVKKPRLPQGRVRFLNDEERSKLLEACRESKCKVLYLVVLLALTTGMRQGEIMGLTKRHIDFDRNSIHLEDTKNGDCRTVPIAKQVRPLLRAHLQGLKENSQLLFPAPSNPQQPICIRSAWRYVVSKVGLEDCCFHTLRHCTASYLAMEGRSPLEIATLLGHKTLQMTKRYSHLSKEHSQQMVDNMSERILHG
jgi:integrase